MGQTSKQNRTVRRDIYCIPSRSPSKVLDSQGLVCGLELEHPSQPTTATVFGGLFQSILTTRSALLSANGIWPVLWLVQCRAWKSNTHTHTHGWQVKLLEKSNIQFTPYLSNPSMTQVHHTHLALHPFPSKNLTCHSAKTPARSTALRATSSESVGRRRSALGREGLQGLQRLRGRLRHLRRTDRRKGAHDVGIFGMHLTTWSNRIGT